MTPDTEEILRTAVQPQESLGLSTTHAIFMGDWPSGSTARLDFHMAEPGTLFLSYNSRYSQAAGPPLQPPLPQIEVVVLRHSGPLGNFWNLGYLNLQKLLSTGTISQSDVLFSDTLTEGSASASTEVGVSGIPESQIAVMASGYSVVPIRCDNGIPGGVGVPATGFRATLALLAAMLIASALFLRRRASRG